MMQLPVLAFFSRSLRTETRAAMTYVVRSLLVVMLAFTLMTTQAAAFSTNAPGLRFLGSLIGANIAIITLVGLAYFASAITEEKEEMTLGLLRMAGLSPVSILLGKSTSRLLFALMLLVVQVPFAVLAVTLGGVAMNQVSASYVLVLAYVMFLCNLALFCSVLCQRSRSAAALTFLLLMLYVCLPGLLEVIGDALVRRQWLVRGEGPHAVMETVALALGAVVPFKRIGEIFSTGYAGGAWSGQVLASLLWGATLFLLAWVVFDVRTRDQRVAAPARGLLPHRTRFLRPLGPGRAWSQAIVWKDFYFVAGGKSKILAKAIGFTLALISFAIVMQVMHRLTGSRLTVAEMVEYTGLTGLWTVFVVSALELAVYASRMFRTEVQWRTLSSLATLPHDMAHIMWAKVVACLPVFLPNVAFLVLTLLMVPQQVGDFMSGVFDEPTAIVFIFFGVAQFILFLCLTAFLSLVVKWGALPLAFILHFMVQNVAMTMLFSLPMVLMGGAFEPAIVMFFLALITLGLAVVFARLTVVRLDRAAGETA